jgi:hypothetical protein
MTGLKAKGQPDLVGPENQGDAITAEGRGIL